VKIGAENKKQVIAMVVLLAILALVAVYEFGGGSCFLGSRSGTEGPSRLAIGAK
jgi:hypothetical protein